jgi:hypothetical protein
MATRLSKKDKLRLESMREDLTEALAFLDSDQVHVCMAASLASCDGLIPVVKWRTKLASLLSLRQKLDEFAAGATAPGSQGGGS